MTYSTHSNSSNIGLSHYRVPCKSFRLQKLLRRSSKILEVKCIQKRIYQCTQVSSDQAWIEDRSYSDNFEVIKNAGNYQRLKN